MLTDPPPAVDTVAMESESPSASVSLLRASIEICPVSSVVVAVSSTATGAVLDTVITVIVKFAESVRRVASAPSPSSVIV